MPNVIYFLENFSTWLVAVAGVLGTALVARKKFGLDKADLSLAGAHTEWVRALVEERDAYKKEIAELRAREVDNAGQLGRLIAQVEAMASHIGRQDAEIVRLRTLLKADRRMYDRPISHPDRRVKDESCFKRIT